MEEEENIQTTIRILSNTSYKFNFLKMKDKFKNQDEFLNKLLDIYNEIKTKKIKKVIVTDDKTEIKEEKKGAKGLNSIFN